MEFLCSFKEEMFLHQVANAFFVSDCHFYFKLHPFDVAIGNKHTCTGLISTYFLERTNLELEIRNCDILR